MTERDKTRERLARLFGRECPRCDGSGEIQFNDSVNRDPQFDDSAPCGTCHGEGVVEEGSDG